MKEVESYEGSSFARILVKRVEEEEQRVGGTIIPDAAREKP
jgi:co-chaperonin GroES (HSP10)